MYFFALLKSLRWNDALLTGEIHPIEALINTKPQNAQSPQNAGFQGSLRVLSAERISKPQTVWRWWQSLQGLSLGNSLKTGNLQGNYRLSWPFRAPKVTYPTVFNKFSIKTIGA